MKLSHLRTFPLRAAAATAALAASALLSGCAMRLNQPITGYTCCNLRPSYDWVSSSNVQGGPMIAAGEPACIESMKRSYYLYGSIGGQYIALRDDAAANKEETLRWVRRIVVAEDPKRQLATWSLDIQLAVRSGKAMRGMTRPQVLMSLGYPSPSDTKDIGADTWLYWTALDDEPVDIGFAPDGSVSAISGSPSAVRTVEHVR